MSASRPPPAILTSVSTSSALTNVSKPTDKLTLVSPKLTLVSIFGSWLWQVPTGAHKNPDLPFGIYFSDFPQKEKCQKSFPK